MKFLSLSALILLPAVSAILLFFPFFNTVRKIRGFTEIITSIHFIYMLLFVALYNPFSPKSVIAESYNWIEPLGIKVLLGIDGVSLILAVLTSFITLMAVIASKHHIKERQRLYYALILLLESTILGVFLARDMFLFFMFWELELIPMYFLISIWGSGRKEYSAMKFLLYTFGGSIFMLLSILALYYCHYIHTGNLTMDINYIGMYNGYPVLLQQAAFWGFFIAFAVKLPVIPFHNWLPDAHVDAPAPISMLLAGVLLKMGAYGFIRVNLFFFPHIFQQFALILFIWGIVNIIYASCIALVQKDLKKLVAYSSIAHMGLVLVALSALTSLGVCGAVFQMVSHGLISAGLFMVVGVIYLRTHTREIALLGGLAQSLPGVYYLTLILSLASIGVPLLSGFPAEVMAYLGAFMSENQIIRHLTPVAMLGIILSAVYMLFMMKNVFCGVMFEKFKNISKIQVHEAVVLVSIVFLIIFIGVYPESIMRIFSPMIENFFST